MKCRDCGHELTCPNCTGDALIPVSAPPPKLACRLPEDWMPKPDTIAIMRAEFPFLAPSWFDAQHRQFLDYWRAKSGKDATKRDWDATWRNWIRRAAEHMTQTGNTTSTVDQKAMGWINGG